MAEPVSQGGIDYPDGGFTGGTGLYSLVGDLAELAARLESISTFNREGTILFTETFEYGLGRWDTSGTSATATVEIVNEVFLSRGYSCKIYTDGTGTPDLNILRYFPYPWLTRYGLELSVRFEGNINNFYIVYLVNDGDETISYIIRYDEQNDEIEYLDSDGNYQTLLTDIDLNDDTLHFVTIKLVVDFLGRTYDRLIINATETDMSDYDAYVTSVTATPTAYVQIGMNCLSGEEAYCYIDNIIATRNEPARRE